MSLPRLSPQRIHRRRRIVSQERPRRRHSTRGVTVQPTVVLDDSLEPGNSGCIDLTSDDSFTGGNVIDLTSVNDSPVVLLSPVDEDRPRNRRHRLRSYHFTTNYSADVEVTSSRTRMQRMIDVDSEESLPPFDVTGTPFSPERLDSNASTAVSPAADKINCPICLDDAKQIRRSGRQIFSTVCGHIYCNQCITQAINTQRCCPTCRKKLTLKQVHVLYL
ncbi:E3 ubiquitin-protein ligase RNF4-like [Gigantopelta aegis]|uniref:E3 ubiquitin-protein ligase RNF4-like n=1 Tax=Gigantopelta aegis TaxID=1735272 RepID=UPI001B88CB7B|nr:E3 ubiquitin-protein ligase RNF4-like [Gigantopelta aegis]XP_041370752.1 E3 ubiquitin-protein ligase RNF4-like [Gigantopelta aegis]